MWISKKWFETFTNQIIEERNEWACKWHETRGYTDRLKIENERLRADQDWFKLRLNQVERERGQLIQAAIGVKIAVPEFVPTYEDPTDALHEMPDLSSIGGDAVDQGLLTDVDLSGGVDYSLLPGYRGK